MNTQVDPTEILKKREQFAVKLRKEKTQNFIARKRKKLAERNGLSSAQMIDTDGQMIGLNFTQVPEEFTDPATL